MQVQSLALEFLQGMGVAKKPQKTKNKQYPHYLPSSHASELLAQGPARQGSNGRPSQPAVVTPFPVPYQPSVTTGAQEPFVTGTRMASSWAATLTVDLGLPAYRTVRHQFLLFKPLRQWLTELRQVAPSNNIPVALTMNVEGKGMTI